VRREEDTKDPDGEYGVMNRLLEIRYTSRQVGAKGKRCRLVSQKSGDPRIQKADSVREGKSRVHCSKDEPAKLFRRISLPGRIQQKRTEG